MKKTRSAKRALLMSALSLLLCVSMLVGTTFAWFTDSVTSAGNIIQSGTLDVDMIDAQGNSMAGQVIEFVAVDGRAQDEILWEPGCTYKTEPVTIINKGNLALKYELYINGIDGNAKLLEAIEWTVTVNGSTTALADLKGKLLPGEKVENIVLSGHMKEEAGNEYQGLKAEGISIVVYATQLTHENDSFGNQYDKYASVATVADMKDALAKGITELNFMGKEINLNYGLSKATVPAGTTVTIANAVVSGKSYGNGADGTVIFENCTFTNTGAYSIHFDNGEGDVIFKNCELYGWNSFGSTLNSVSFYDCSLYGNGTYGLIRSYVDLYVENCYIDTSNANHNDGYPEGLEVVSGATLTEKNNIYAASSAADLDEILAGGGDAVLTGSLNFNANETSADSGYRGATGVSVKGGTLDGNGNSLGINNWGTWDVAVHTTGGTIKNLTINSGMRGIFMCGASEDVYIDNVVFDGTIYTFNSDDGNKNYGVYISNSTLNGWTSHSDVHKEVVYTNCDFGEGNGYAFCRPYGPTSFVGCDFEAGFQLDAIGKVTFKNCTIGGVALTAENLSTLVTSNIANASVIG